MGWDRPFDYDYTINDYRVSSQSSSPPMGWDRPFDGNYTIDGYRVSSQVIALLWAGTGRFIITTPSMSTE